MMGNLKQSASSRFSSNYVLEDLLYSNSNENVRVHKCYSLKTKKQYCVKILNKTKFSPKKSIGLKHEITVLNKLNHKHIINLKDYFQSSRRCYLVFELCYSSVLDALRKTKNERISEKKAATIIYKLCSAINYCHNNGIVHRDIKLENLLITKKGKIKLIDFGLSHFIDIKPSLHRMYTCVGTPYYASPEIISGQNYSYGFQVDYWSVGICLYRLLCGKYPFDANNLAVLYRNIVSKQLKFPDTQLSKNAKHLLQGLLTKDPKKRYNYKQIVKHPFFDTIKKNDN